VYRCECRQKVFGTFVQQITYPSSATLFEVEDITQNSTYCDYGSTDIGTLTELFFAFSTARPGRSDTGNDEA
jgi:hypothetical protein